MLGRSPERHLAALEPEDQILVADEDRLDDIARAFARVIDAKSPFTYLHSERVAELAVTIGRRLHFDEVELRDLRRAGLLHDIGKLGVSTLILDKPDRLTERERAEIRVHPAYTQRILERVAAFSGIVEIASAHHERLDGKGYHLGLPAERLSPMSRALAVADVYEAITADRPYRRGTAAERGARDPARPGGHRALRRVGRGAGVRAGLGPAGDDRGHRLPPARRRTGAVP